VGDVRATTWTGSAWVLLILTGLIEAGTLTPVLDRTYPLADTAEGLRRVEQGHARGKVVITVP
jgi:NADPH:quinone reductase-like Zn-dependent oxidoreductase